MTVDLEAHLKTMLAADHKPDGRNASFDYCYNHFQQARDRSELSSLADGKALELSCLQLGFYLASWGMLRGSTQLLGKSVHALKPVVQAIVSEPPKTWAIDVATYADRAQDVMDVSRRIREAFHFTNRRATDTLVTKTMLGVFGCVPAFDTNFHRGFKCSGLRVKTLKRIGDYYIDNQQAIDGAKVYTLDFATEESTVRRYPAAKIIDMVFYQEGSTSR